VEWTCVADDRIFFLADRIFVLAGGEQY